MKNYRRRIGFAGMGSFAVHALAVALLSLFVLDSTRGVVPTAEPIVVSFRPPKPETARRVVDPGAPAELPSEATELFSDRNTRAQDSSSELGDPDRPSLDSEDDFEELGAPATPPDSPPAKSAAAPPPQPETDPIAPTAEETRVEPEAPEATEKAAAPEETPAAEAPANKALAEAPAGEQAAPPAVTLAKSSPELPERFELARQIPAAAVPAESGEEARGRKGGGVEAEGFTSFEANEHELGAYMLGIRKKVERTWKTALRFRYSGSSATSAVLECAIRPDGTLEYINILDPGSSATYAALCKEAVELAGPFGTFPFPVPDVYRTKNLVVKWKFSFM